MKKALNILIKVIIVFGIILILLLLFSPVVHPVGIGGHRISCSQNIIQLELALQMYQNNNNKFYPSVSGDKGLEVLFIEQYINNKLVFKCPGDKAREKSFWEKIFGGGANKKNIDFNSDYIYLGGFKEDETPKIPILFDKVGNHKDYCNILFSDRTREALNFKYFSYDDLLDAINQKKHYPKGTLDKIKQKIKEALQNNKETLGETNKEQ